MFLPGAAFMKIAGDADCLVMFPHRQALTCQPVLKLTLAAEALYRSANTQVISLGHFSSLRPRDITWAFQE